MAAIAVAGVGMMMMCCSSVAAVMMGGEEKEDPVVPKTPAEIAAAKAVADAAKAKADADAAQAAADALAADPDATPAEIAAAKLVADNAAAASAASAAAAASAASAAAAAAAAATPPPAPFSFDLCTSDWNKLIQECKNVSTCKAVGQQDNGCWHELKADPTAAQLNSYKPLLQKKHDYGLFYLGEAGCNVNIKNVGAACLSNSKCTGVGKQSNNCWHTLQNSGSTKKLLTGYTEFKRPKDLEYQACTNDQTYIKAACDADPNCKSIGQQTNGCWHLLPRDPNVDDYNNYKKPILRKANSYGKYSYYLGEGGCHNNRQSVVNDCNNNTDCTFAGQQSNGCWHLLSGKPSGNIIDTSGYSNKYNR